MMKARKLLFGAVAIAAAATAGLVACNKNLQKEPNSNHALTAGILATCDCSNTITKDSTLTGSINVNLTLVSTIRYKLSGLVFLVGNHTLTIQPGTTIQGIKAAAGTVGGGLVITRGSKLIAEGTSSCPIVFTSDQASPVSGDWAGVILLGKAQTNNAGAYVEGINNTAYPGIDLQYGSSDSIVSSVNVNNDTSGSLRCVRIEYAGYALSQDNEINGLTLAGVGRGTKLDYVEVFKSNDDAFEFFGGCVNASHLLSIDALDDMFDTDNGYTGSMSYCLGLADTTRSDQSQSNGFESDNNATGTITAGLPITNPKYSYITIVGVNSKTKASTIKDTTISGTAYHLRYGRGGHFRRGSMVQLSNSIIFGYNYGISIDSQLASPSSLDRYTAGTTTFSNVYSQGYSTTATSSVGPWSKESNGQAADGTGFSTTALIATPSPSSSSNPWGMAGSGPFSRPAAGGAITNFVPASGLPQRAYGAFPNGTDWTNPDGCGTNNWTRYH